MSSNSLLTTSGSGSIKLKSTAVMVNKVLNDSQWAKRFRSFLEENCAEENLDCWTEIERYKSGFETLSEEENTVKANRILNTYFDDRSPFEVNIDDEIKRDIVKCMSIGLIHKDTFQQAQVALYLLLEESQFPAFLRSDHFLRPTKSTSSLPAGHIRRVSMSNSVEELLHESKIAPKRTSDEDIKSPKPSHKKAKLYLKKQKEKWLKVYDKLSHKKLCEKGDTLEKEEFSQIGQSVSQVKRLAGIINKLKLYTDTDNSVMTSVLQEITVAASIALNCERSSIWFYNGEKTNITSYDLYQRKEQSHSYGVELKSSDFPQYFNTLLEEKSLAADDANTDFRTCEFSKIYLKPLGINSMLDAPIKVNGVMVGVVCNEHIGPIRHWTKDEEEFSVQLGEFVSETMEGLVKTMTSRGLQDEIPEILKTIKF